MKAFEVHVNGAKRCVAGLDKHSIVTTILHCMLPRNDDEPKRSVEDEEVAIRVGGLTIEDGKPKEHVQWLDEVLTVGDEILIKVVDTESPSDPSRRIPADPLQRTQDSQTALTPEQIEKRRKKLDFIMQRVKEEFGDD